jgi:hypothetical protein
MPAGSGGSPAHRLSSTNQSPPPWPPRLLQLGAQSVETAMAGVSAPMLGGPPNWAERQSALTQAEQRNPPHTSGNGVSAA